LISLSAVLASPPLRRVSPSPGNANAIVAPFARPRISWGQLAGWHGGEQRADPISRLAIRARAQAKGGVTRAEMPVDGPIPGFLAGC